MIINYEPDIEFIKAQTQAAMFAIPTLSWRGEYQGNKSKFTRMALDFLINEYNSEDGPPYCFTHWLHHEPFIGGGLGDGLHFQKKYTVHNNVVTRLTIAYIVLYSMKSYDHLLSMNPQPLFGRLRLKQFINMLYCARMLPAEFCSDIPLNLDQPK